MCRLLRIVYLLGFCRSVLYFWQQSRIMTSLSRHLDLRLWLYFLRAPVHLIVLSVASKLILLNKLPSYTWWWCWCFYHGDGSKLSLLLTLLVNEYGVVNTSYTGTKPINPFIQPLLLLTVSPKPLCSCAGLESDCMILFRDNVTLL